MTSASIVCTALPTVTVGDLDPFVAPPPSHRVVDAPIRCRVVLHGLVLDVRVATWVGGPVLEVTLSDGSGVMCLAFLDRRHIAGIEPGRVLTAAGTIGLRHGRRVVLNPYYWRHAPMVEVADA